MLSALLVSLLVKQAPAAPTPTYPANDLETRDRYTRLQVSTAPTGVTSSVWQFRVFDGGAYDCSATNSCPMPSTSGSFDSFSTGGLDDGLWCFRAAFGNDAGLSPFSSERCWREDRTPPPQPLGIDAGLSNGIAYVSYVATEDVGVEASLVQRVCAGAVELVTGDVFTPYCAGNPPWVVYRPPDAGANFFTGTLALPLPPGTWQVETYTYDGASFGSDPLLGPTFVVVEQGVPPPTPYWRAPDGGLMPDDAWTNDTYLTRVVYPGVAGQQWLVVQKRDEGSGWYSISARSELDATMVAYCRYDPPRKQVRYSVIHGDGGVSPWSSPLTVRYDNLAPEPFGDCALSVAPGERVVSIAWDGGVDSRSPTSWAVQLEELSDGGRAVLGADAGGATLTLADGTWAVTAVATDEAGNSTTRACGAVIIPAPLDGGAVFDAGVADAGRVESDAGVVEAQRNLGVGCACGSVDAPGLLVFALVWWFRRKGFPHR